MPRPIPLLFCRYALTIHDDALSPQEQYEVLQELRGKPVAHRKADPVPEDFDTFLMRVRQKRYHGRAVITFDVAHQPGYREVSKYDKETDDVVAKAESTDEVRHTKLLLLPEVGVLAIDDRVSQSSLGGKAAASRFKSIFAQIRGAKTHIEFSGSNADLQRALDTWDLRSFSFDVRPFNPTVRKMGEQLHELMKRDNIGHIRGVATPVPNEAMRDSHSGLISEAAGLAQHGYGQVAVSGTTPGGFPATLGKPKFDSDKNKNLKRQAEPRTLKVYIEEQGTVEAEEAEVVRALLEFYGS